MVSKNRVFLKEAGFFPQPDLVVLGDNRGNSVSIRIIENETHTKGIIMDILGWLLKKIKSKGQKRRTVYVSFAAEDLLYRDYLYEQARLAHSSFEFINVPGREEIDEEWKKKCQQPIKRCHCMIVLLSKQTGNSAKVNWEVSYARLQGIKVIGMYINKNEPGIPPPVLMGCKIIPWSWENLQVYLK